jgi:hypothetical protein
MLDIYPGWEKQEILKETLENYCLDDQGKIMGYLVFYHTTLFV